MHTTPRHGRLYTNLALTAVVGLLGVIAFNPAHNPLIAQASALPPGPPGGQPSEDGLVSAAEQRKQIIAELRTVNTRLDRVESMLSRGLSVKVTEMPPIQLPQEKDKPKADKPAR